MLPIYFVKLPASGTSVWQEHKVYANYTRCPDAIQGFPYGLSPTYRLPSLNLAIAPRSANSAWASETADPTRSECPEMKPYALFEFSVIGQPLQLATTREPRARLSPNALPTGTHDPT